MFKLRHAIALLSFIIMGLGVFQLKYYVKALQYDVAEMRKQAIHEKSTISVLRAEWAYLNKPERVRELANRYLDLAPIESAQIANQPMPENFAIVNRKLQPVLKVERTIVADNILARNNKSKHRIEKIKWDEKRKRFIIKDK